MPLRSSRLSPQARKAALRAGPAHGAVRVVATVELAAGQRPETLDVPLSQLGAELRGWSDHSHVMTVSIDPACLDALGAIRGVTFVQVGGRMANPSKPPG